MEELRRSSTLLSLAAAFAAVAPAARGQVPSSSIIPSDTTGRCHGETVSGIDILSEPPESGAAAGVWRGIQNVAGVHHATTQPSVIESFLDLAVGQPCTERRRLESERVLRAQPFLASARVRAFPDSAGRVRIQVSTVDEVPLVIGGRVNGVGLDALDLGDANIKGTGISAVVSGERGHAYRYGFGVRLLEYAMFHRPYVAMVNLQRYPLGHLIDLSLTHPFYTDLQASAWHARYRDEDVYMGLARPAGDPLALDVRQRRWEAGGLLREHLFGQVGIVGVLASGTRVDPADVGVVVSDSGLMPDTGVTLRGRYTSFRATRPAVLAGVRVVHFVTVQGFNTLAAFEDLPSGVQWGALFGRGIHSLGADDAFLSSSFYAGHVSPGSYFGLQVEAEGRDDYDTNRWDDLITSARFAWYGKESSDKTFVLSDELSGGSRPRLPLQLTFGSYDGGLPGYRGSRLAGAWRNVVRAEQRWVLGSLFGHADLGIAGFADAGTLWAGAAPYGTNTPLRMSFGVSLLGAYPMHSKRLLRADFAIPTKRDGNGAWELRFSVLNLTRFFWRDPSDIARARAGPLPSNLFTWPSR